MSFVIFGDFSARTEAFVDRLGEHGITTTLAELEDQTAATMCAEHQIMGVLVYIKPTQVSTALSIINRLGQAQYRGMILIVFQSEDLDQVTAIRLLDAGADDVLFQPNLEYVLAKLRVITRRAGQATSDTLVFGNTAYTLASKTLTIANTAVSLSKRDKALMTALAVRWEADVSRQVIFAAMYGGDADVEEKIIDVYIHRLRKKLSAAHSDITIRTLTGFGYRLEYAPHTQATNA